jgi:Uma2 family endonuclease
MATTETQHKHIATTIPPIGWESAGIRMTTEEFDAIEDYDELYRYELVDGVLVVLPIPHEAEAVMNELLGNLLRCYNDGNLPISPTGQRGKGNFPRSSFGLFVSLDTLPRRYIHLENIRRQVDRVIWLGLNRLPNSKEDVPTIAVEFVSAGKRNWIRDYETKRDEYLAAGVREYWIIDRFDRTMMVYAPGPDGTTIRVVGEAETYQTDLLPGFELPLAQLLAEADKWNK